MPDEGHDPAQIRMFILDVLRHDDIENLVSILKLLNNRGCIGWRAFWPEEFSPGEVVPQLQHLVHEGLVRALRETGQGDELEPITPDRINATDERLWFALTDAGRHAWNEWDPPTTA
jgi:hypothetical protein